MESLYEKAEKVWKENKPTQIKALESRSDDCVFSALNDVLGDILSPSWETDSRIAWALMQGRDA